jgi:exonuclease VII small subunit
MYRKITKKVSVFYEIEEYDGDESKAELFKDVPMDVVIGSMLFFWTLNKELLSNILLHLESKAAREGLNLEEALESVGGGIKLLFDCRENLESTLEKLEESLFTNHSRYYLT